MHRRSLAVVVLSALATSCASGGDAATTTRGSGSSAPGRADVGGYELAYGCTGEGAPAVVLEAGLGAGGREEFSALIPRLEGLGVRVCTYDRAGVGSSDERRGDGRPTAATQATELHRLVETTGIPVPFVLVPHSYGGLVARVYADRYPDDVAGFVFEDVSTAWEIDLWPRWDPSPWVDGAQTVDIDTTEREVLEAAPFGDRPSIVVSQSTYAGEGIPGWAGRIFARQQAKLAALGDDVIHVRADGTGHFIHRERPELMIAAIAEVVAAVRDGRGLRGCAAVFGVRRVTCLSG